MKVEIKTVKLSEIKLNPDNPRRIGNVDMERLVKSLTDFPDMLNIREIVVDETMTVLGGNMRMLALRKIGAKEATAKIVKGLTEAQKREFIIKDNGTFGDWDFDLLANSWADLPLDDFGIDLPEDWLKGLDADPSDAEPQIDRASELQKIWQTETGQLWLIGQHRLLVGDSTKKEDVERVMSGEKADACLTDPPYGVGVVYSTFKDTPENAVVLIKKVMPMILSIPCAAVTPGVPVMWDYPRPAWVGAWVHPASSGGCPWGFAGNNPILFYGADPYLKARKGRRPDSIVMPSDRQGQDGHPTPKPLKVWEWLVERVTIKAGLIVFDPFLGSGTTMVACQNLNRKCRGIEISPCYCAVILQRMTDAFPSIEIKRLP